MEYQILNYIHENEQLSQQLKAADNLYYSQFSDRHNEDCYEQYVDENGQLYFKDDDGEWVLDEG